ncbi:MAG: two pore domain potassium channel family protein [Candidatus Omnitrophica bacterium]|nr:two pore domain potassium channel family protein [Candidatus Omnitrophota bacterium]
MVQDKRSLEQEANQLFDEKKYQEAGELYLQAAKTFQRQEKHGRAAICLAASASSLALILGERTYHRVAGLYEEAAKEAEASKDLEYASMLYKFAAVCYERDHDNNAFSECLFLSKEAYRRFLRLDLFNSKKTSNNVILRFNLQLVMKRFIPLITSTFSSLIWGHGERPHRTIGFGLTLILMFAVLYSFGHFSKGNVILRMDLLQSIYFSFTAYTKVGPEDFSPVGINKAIAVIEAFIGIFTIPLYLTGLCRKYLRY